jgi:DNA-binding NarL/FixJ family response regulator
LSGEEGPAAVITVLLVEDDAPTCWRLQDALAKAGYQVKAAATLAEARALLGQGGPRVLLTDLQLPDGHGVDLIRETRQRFPDIEIMVISILGDEESVISAITVGATGYLLKDAFPTDIAATVRDLIAGHSPISASIARFIVRRTQSQPEPPPGPPLNTARQTPREIDILSGLANSAMPRSPAISACRVGPSPGISRASTVSSRSIPEAKPCSRRSSRT